MQLEIIIIEPQGFCFGVSRAILMMQAIAKKEMPKPWYLIGNLVHNRFVKSYLNDLGFIIKEDLDKARVIDEINSGTVIFTAHGIDQAIKQAAIRKNLNVIDATCPFVTQSFTVIKSFLTDGYDIIYLGKKDHPETEAALSINNRIHLIEGLDDIDNIMIDNDKIAITNQTTMSKYDIEQIEATVLKKFPQALIMDKVCYATKIRQEKLRSIAFDVKNKKEKIAFIIIGDKMSNNTKRLAMTAQDFSKKDVFEIEHLNDLPFERLHDYERIYLASGTSTPNSIVSEVYQYLLKGDFKTKTTSLQVQDYHK